MGLLIFSSFSTTWLALYAWCGVSDVLDGLLARCWHLDSVFGAKFDSFADTAFVVVLIVELFSQLIEHVWLTAWISIIISIRLISLTVCYKRFKKLSFLHTTANKITGITALFAVVLIPWFGLVITFVPSCILATLSAVQELALMGTMDNLDLNMRRLLSN